MELLLKTKYIKRWRGANGKYHYLYHGLKGRKRANPVSAGSKTLYGVSDTDQLDILHATYKRQAPGHGVEKPIASKRDLHLILTKTTFAILSAGRNPSNSEDMKLSDMQIKARHDKLLGRLKDEGFVYTQCKGKYENPEDSIMVMMHDADRDSAMEIGEAFNQDAVVFCSNGKNEMIYTTGAKKGKATMAGTGYEETPNADDYYTDMPLADGKHVKFCLSMSDVAKALGGFVRNFIKSYHGLFLKSRKMPIGTVSHGRKKIADGDWRELPKGRTRPSLSGSTGDKIRDAMPKGNKASAYEKKLMSNAVSSAVNQSYYKAIPIDDIDTALNKHGFLLVQEDGTPWSGMLLGADSHAVLQVGRMNDYVEKDGMKLHTILKNAGVALSWYRDEKRQDSKYDIVAYLS